MYLFPKINGKLEKMFITKFPKLAPKGDNDDLLPAGFKYFPHRKPLLAIMKGKVDSTADGEDGSNSKGLVGLQNLQKQQPQYPLSFSIVSELLEDVR